MRRQRFSLGLWLAVVAAPWATSALEQPAYGAEAEHDDFDAAPPVPEHPGLPDELSPPVQARDEEDEDDSDALDPPRRHPHREDVLAMERQMVTRRADASHQIMKQFMHNFARNMRYAILTDSKGDMPEEQRQRMLRQLQEGGASAPEDVAATPEEPPTPHVRRTRRRAHAHPRLNMLNAHRQFHTAHATGEGEGEMLNRREGRDRQEVEMEQETSRKVAQKHHIDSLLSRLDACKTKQCVHALWTEAQQARHLARPEHHRRSAPPREDRREDVAEGDVASSTRGPPLLQFTKVPAAEVEDTPAAAATARVQTEVQSATPSSAKSAVVGGVIGFFSATAIFLLVSYKQR